jgi:hypothetical protein
MTPAAQTVALAERLLGWRAAPDRFMKSGRSWIPKWRFNPFDSINDAFLLLDGAGATYTLAVGADGIFTAEVRFGGRCGTATGTPHARTITLAIARAAGIEEVE